MDSTCEISGKAAEKIEFLMILTYLVKYKFETSPWMMADNTACIIVKKARELVPIDAMPCPWTVAEITGVQVASLPQSERPCHSAMQPNFSIIVAHLCTERRQ